MYFGRRSTECCAEEVFVVLRSMEPNGRSSRVAEGRILSCGGAGEDRLMIRVAWVDFCTSGFLMVGRWVLALGGFHTSTKISRARSSPRQVSHHSRAEPSVRLVSNGGKARLRFATGFSINHEGAVRMPGGIETPICRQTGRICR